MAENSVTQLDVKTWPVSQFRTYHQQGILDLSPDYQRRPVWSSKSQMLFIDSLARKVPAGAITLYEDDSKGYKSYEVIDGKQRLTALIQYLEAKLEMYETTTKVDEEEEDLSSLGSDLAKALYEAVTYSKLSAPMRIQFEQYDFPVFIITGPRESAVRAFTRMNSNTYALKPQEIRNAVFHNTPLLNAAIELSERLTSEPAPVSRSGWV